MGTPLEQFSSMLRAESQDELLKEFVAFAHRLQFDIVGAMAVIDHVQGEPEFVAVANTPAAYLECYDLNVSLTGMTRLRAYADVGEVASRAEGHPHHNH